MQYYYSPKQKNNQAPIMFDILSLVTASNLIIFAIVLFFTKSQRRDSRHLLSLLFFSLAIELLEMYMVHSGYYQKNPYFLKISLITSALTGMAFYHYIISILGPTISFKGNKLFHFIPAIIALTIFVLFQTHNKEWKVEYYDHLDEKMPLLEIGINLSLTLLTLAYFIATYKLLLKLKKCLENNFSGLDQVEISWLIHFVLGLILSLVMLILTVLVVKNERIIEQMGIVVISSIYVVSLIRIIKKSTFVIDLKLINSPHCLSLENNTECPINQNNNKDNLSCIFEDLRKLIDEDLVYCIPKLSLEQLAEKLNIKKYLLSQAINKYAGQNYFTFINTYRIEEAKRKLRNEEFKEYSVESIGLSCGFNSASSFFLVFKRLVGQTPTAYRNGPNKLNNKIQ